MSQLLIRFDFLACLDLHQSEGSEHSQLVPEEFLRSLGPLLEHLLDGFLHHLLILVAVIV
jgi:hypothetical protein